MMLVSKTDRRGRNITLAVLMAVAAMTATSVLAEEEAGLLDVLDFDISAAWDSRYVSEGRDNLAGDSLAGTTIEAAYKGLSVNVWYASSPDTDYREVNVGTAYTLEWDEWEAYVSYTFLRFLSDKENDNEVGAGLSYSGLPAGFTAGVDGYYSFDAEGAFFETYIDREYEVADWLTLTPAVVMGWNAGYMADGHDGANHLALVLEAAVPLKAGLELSGNIAYSFAINDNADKYEEDDVLRSMFYAGVALNVSF
jgi:hypothetical protein